MADERPTGVTVIGWVWIVLGGLMCFAAVLAVTSHFLEGDILPGMFIPIAGAVQSCVGVFSLYSGIAFLRLKSWSRGVLEVLTWLMLLYVVGFGAYGLYGILGDFEIGYIVLLAGFLGIIGLYVFALSVMIKCLRSKRVCEVMYGKPVRSKTEGED